MNRYVRAFVLAKIMQGVAVGWIFGTYVVFLQSHGLSLIQANTLNFAFMASSILLAAPSGALADRIGQRKTYLIGMAAWGTGMFVYGQGHSFLSFLVAEAVAGVGSAMMTDSLECWLRNATDEVVTHKALGKAMILGTVIGTIPSALGGVVGEKWGLQWPWFIGGASSIVAWLIIWLLLRRLGGERVKKNQPRRLRATTLILRESWNTPVIRFTIWAAFVANACFQAFNMFWGPILKEASGQSWWLGFVSIGIAIASASGTFLATSGKLPTNGKGVTLTILSIGLPMLMPAFFSKTIPILFFFLLHEIGRGGLTPMLFTYSHLHISDEGRSTANSARVIASTLGRAVGLLVSGWLTLVFPPLQVWRISAMALVIFSIWIWRKK